MAQKFLYAWLPYLSILVFFVGSYFQHKSHVFRLTPERRRELREHLDWEVVPLKYGFLVILFGHIIALMIPSAVLSFNGDPLRMVLLEVTGLVFGLGFLTALLSIFFRRWFNPRVRTVANSMDMIMEILLISQVMLGCWTAAVYRWGSSWGASNVSPYLWSILKFQPHLDSVQVLPHVMQLHIITGFIILIVFPFTRFWPQLLLIVFGKSSGPSR